MDNKLSSFNLEFAKIPTISHESDQKKLKSLDLWTKKHKNES